VVVSLGNFSVVPPTEPCALKSTQPLKVSTRDFSWGKDGRFIWLTTYHSCSAEMSRKSVALIYPEPLGPPRPVAGHLYFTVLFISPLPEKRDGNLNRSLSSGSAWSLQALGLKQGVNRCYYVRHLGGK